MKRLSAYVLFVLLLVFLGASPALSDTYTYLIYNQYGGTWQDANKTGNGDTLMCWAAAASNVLAYEGWGTSVYNTQTAIFQDFVAHWTNNTGDPSWAWNWWFTGANPPFPGASYPDVPGGGDYYPSLKLSSYYSYASGSRVMSSLDADLHQDKGVTMVISKGSLIHAVTVWGFGYSAPGAYNSIYITDSDDGQTALMNYPVTLQGSAWYLGGGYSGWRISCIEALAANPSPSGQSLLGTGLAGETAVPIAPSWLLFGTGLLPLIFRRRGGKPQEEESL